MAISFWSSFARNPDLTCDMVSATPAWQAGRQKLARKIRRKVSGRAKAGNGAAGTALPAAKLDIGGDRNQIWVMSFMRTQIVTIAIIRMFPIAG
ncbi:MAG: hypothetical protein ACK4PN_04360 [Allorhizobium sp.]